MKRKVVPKFRRGDRVRIAADLGPTMSHFPKDREAIVLDNDYEKYGYKPNPQVQYGLLIHYPEKPKMQSLTTGKVSNCEWASTSWYYEGQLSLLEEANDKTFAIIGRHGDR